MIKENNRNDGDVKPFQKIIGIASLLKMNHRHRIALKIYHRRGLRPCDPRKVDTTLANTMIQANTITWANNITLVKTATVTGRNSRRKNVF